MNKPHLLGNLSENLRLAIILAIVLLVPTGLYIAHQLQHQSQANPAANSIITGINAEISSYINTTHIYLSSTRAFPGISLPIGSRFQDTFTFANNGSLPLSIDSIGSDTSGFTLLNVTPRLPYFLLPGSSLDISAEIESPSKIYSGTLNISVNETYYEKYPPARWSEQIGLLLTGNWSTLAYNVSAVSQDDLDGCGPAYLLNGLSNTGYWYQIGLSYNWCLAQGGYLPGFHANYEVFAPDGSTIYPASGSGIINLSGLDEGDTVLLELQFSNGNVVMEAKDWDTGSYVQVNFSAEGANKFSPPVSTSNSGFFTGLMTEWDHVNQYPGGEQGVTYAPYCATGCMPDAWLFADEFYNSPLGQNVIFSNVTQMAYPPSNNTKLMSNGAIARYYANGSFVTGESFNLNIP